MDPAVLRGPLGDSSPPYLSPRVPASPIPEAPERPSHLPERTRGTAQDFRGNLRPCLVVAWALERPWGDPSGQEAPGEGALEGHEAQEGSLGKANCRSWPGWWGPAGLFLPRVHQGQGRTGAGPQGCFRPAPYPLGLGWTPGQWAGGLLRLAPSTSPSPWALSLIFPCSPCPASAPTRLPSETALPHLLLGPPLASPLDSAEPPEHPRSA